MTLTGNNKKKTLKVSKLTSCINFRMIHAVIKCFERSAVERIEENSNDQGPVSRKSRKLFGPEKPFVKLWPTYSVKLVFSYVVKGIKIKIKVTASFRASIRLRFEDTKLYHPKCARNVSGLPRNRPLSRFRCNR